MDQSTRNRRGKAKLISRPRKSRVVWVIARAVAQSGKERQLRSLLRRMVAPTHAEQGCLIYDLYESEWPGKFYFYELWASSRDLHRHAASEHFQSLLKALPEVAADSIEVTLLNKLNL
jgi:quinol monooxygenase YgiN